MGYYPVFLEMKDRRCVVIGGGAVAQRKVEGLLAAGAKVTVISPVITEELRSLIARCAIAHVARGYQKGDLADYATAFVATDDPEINAAVYSDSRSLNIWVNVADDPAHCDFILPAIVRRGELTVAVSSSGASPAVTRAIREELEEYFTDDYARLVQIASEVRRELSEKSQSLSGEAWNEALKGPLRRLIREGGASEAKKFLLEALEAHLCR
jgi:precorrin-2 dehydrogenase/sirohydrochlorin ferrochelatase